MAIDVYWQDGKNRRWVGGFSAKESLLSTFASRTGIRVDEYGTTRLSVQQLRLLISTAQELNCIVDLDIPPEANGVILLEGD